MSVPDKLPNIYAFYNNSMSIYIANILFLDNLCYII
jgi:hypothetical protein